MRKKAIKLSQNLIKDILHFGGKQPQLQTHTEQVINYSVCHQTIKHLKHTASHQKIVSLSANQIGIDQSVFVCLKKQYIKPGKWRNYELQGLQEQLPENMYQAVINPKLINQTPFDLYDYQQCPSIQGMKFKVLCPTGIQIVYNEEKSFKLIQKQLLGFQCRLWHHEVRHLFGSLAIDDQICNSQFELLDDFACDVESIQYFENVRGRMKFLSKKNLQQLKKQKVDWKQEQSTGRLLLQQFGKKLPEKSENKLTGLAKQNIRKKIMRSIQSKKN